MAFKLGNFFVKEIIYGVSTDFQNRILYTLDQLTNASIEISSDPTDITDKHGNVVRSVYQSKTGTLTANSALLSPMLMNAQSGSDYQVATSTNPLIMPKIVVVAAGSTYTASDIHQSDDGATSDVDESVPSVIPLYNNGAKDLRPVTHSTTASLSDDAITFGWDSTNKKVILPDTAGSGANTDVPDKYLIKYDRDVESGLTLMNTASKFPDTQRLTLYAAVGDPCDDHYKAAYIYAPSFQPDPSVTISLDTENQEVDFNGNLQIDYCGGDKVLYYIYFPDENAVTTVAVRGDYTPASIDALG